MGDVLHVDFALLDGSSRSLQAIGSALEGTPRQRDAVVAACGHPDVADAVREWADNWDRHRGELVEQVGALASAVTQAAATFHQADTQLGQALVTEPAR